MALGGRGRFRRRANHCHLLGLPGWWGGQRRSAGTAAWSPGGAGTAVTASVSRLGLLTWRRQTRRGERRASASAQQPCLPACLHGDALQPPQPPISPHSRPPGWGRRPPDLEAKAGLGSSPPAAGRKGVLYCLHGDCYGAPPRRDISMHEKLQTKGSERSPLLPLASGSLSSTLLCTVTYSSGH